MSNLQIEIVDDEVYLEGPSGEYFGFLEDGKVSFSVVYDDMENDIDSTYDETDIGEFLGEDHVFITLAKQYDHTWEIGSDYVQIEIKLENT